MKALVGYTGFVGSNICETGRFEALYNSKNIEEAFGTHPELMVYAGLRAEKYIANNAPEKDMELIVQAEKNIAKIHHKKLVLISTIDVFNNPKDVDENSIVEMENLNAYGRNRYMLELWVRNNYPDALIIRLPGLFGKNIKKNFIYDFINRIPLMLNESKMQELSAKDLELKSYYELQCNGFYKCKDIDKSEKALLKDKFRQLGFTALNFTDSRSKYQFYDLQNLSSDIEFAIKSGISIWHPATEPVSAAEIYRYLTGDEFVNELTGKPANYDYKSIHAELFGGADGYICKKETILKAIKEFVER